MNRKTDIVERILNSSIALFISKGVDGTTMESIAEDSGVSKRTLYKYYPQKELILEEITNNFLDNIVNKASIEYDSSIDFDKHLKDVITNRVEAFVSEEYIESGKLLSNEMMKGTTFKEEHFERFAQFEQKFIKWIDEAKKDGNITSSFSSEQINKQFHSLLKGETYYPVLYGILENSEENIKLAEEELFNVFKEFYCR